MHLLLGQWAGWGLSVSQEGLGILKPPHAFPVSAESKDCGLGVLSGVNLAGGDRGLWTASQGATCEHARGQQVLVTKDGDSADKWEMLGLLLALPGMGKAPDAENDTPA